MCGIAGIVSNGAVETYKATLGRMTDSIRHRGPDGAGEHSFGNCMLGHRRLAIVDLETGAQPLLSPDRKVGITFNGEIYGYRELRRELADYPFATQSDTEVILALYLRHGADAVRRLPGMFAFAIWDDRSNTLLCARDRFGEKPFYYAIGRNREFVFASELKAILASKLVDAKIDPRSVARFLQRQCVSPEHSIYANVHVLPPGHLLSLERGALVTRRYWDLPVTENKVEPAVAVEHIQELLQRAVRRQLIADVPVGAFLSGGLDSTTICFEAGTIVPGLHTFSFDFEGDHSEVEFARAAARRYGTQHTELSAPLGDIADHVVRLCDVFDEPFADSSSIPTWLLAREARRHVKVALTGDAGDELFGGYLWYQSLIWMQQSGRLGPVRWLIARVVNRALAFAGVSGADTRERRVMGQSFARRFPSQLAAHRHQLRCFTDAQMRNMGIQMDPSEYDMVNVSNPSGTLNDALNLDVVDYMPANNLTRTDRCSMAHGLELRAPFLDVDLANYCISLPHSLKATTTEDKIALRRTYSNHWPPEIRTRRKQGFGAPIDRWLQTSSMQMLLKEYLGTPSAAVYQHLDFIGTQRLLRSATPAEKWVLLQLGVWCGRAGSRTHV
jgi:asparagine synthase (glutamine-hydrolysing)